MVKLRHGIEDKNHRLCNEEIANKLMELAELLEIQGANVFRIQAYRNAAKSVQNLREPIYRLLEKEGLEGLRKLPGIGQSISRGIEHLLQTGKLSLLDHLRGEMKPERVLATVTGIGPGLAKRIHETLGIEKLIDLEAAVYSGRLAQLPEFGKKRLRAIQESLARRFNRNEKRRFIPPAYHHAPRVDEILDIDKEYRRKAREGKLSLISPKYFNPEQKPWLPVLHTQRENRHYTALFSNTVRAHELGMTHDWVVIHQDGQNGNGQWTVITSLFGQLKGRRIIPEHEAECQNFYQNVTKNSSTRK